MRAPVRFGCQEWRRLLFAHWPLPTATLRQLVPKTLELDEFGGSAWISLVAFLVQRAQPLGLRFEETNVRTYVHVEGRDHGVYFFTGRRLAPRGHWCAGGLWSAVLLSVRARTPA